jgi:hypothetical protein
VESLLHLFCSVDDFCRQFLPAWQQGQLAAAPGKRRRDRSLSTSEIMTILIAFHQSHYRDFKAFYNERVLAHWRREFPGLVSYHRFVEFTPSALVPLLFYLSSRFGSCTGTTFADSTAVGVCRNPRIGSHNSHKTFANLAQRGKTCTGWFFGFKLHLLINDRGDLLAVTLTPGNVDDRAPLPNLLRQVRHLFGKLFADKGYLSAALRQQVRDLFRVELITRLKRNMKNVLMPMEDKLLLRRRALIESVVEQLKNISQIEHTRHRSPANFLVNLICGLIAYTHQPKKPSLGIERNALVPA